MTPDLIIEELRRVREEIAAQFNYDVFAIGAMLRAEQQGEGGHVVYSSAQPDESEVPPTDKGVERAA